MTLEDLGWNSYFSEQFAPYAAQEFVVGRVSSEQRNLYRVYTEAGETTATISGKFRFSAVSRGDLPAVGDWVVLTLHQGGAQIHGVLPRSSKFSRKAAGTTTEEQIVAANVETVFLVSALNNDFNLRRLERYLTLGWESGAFPVIVLSKADLCQDLENKRLDVEGIAPGVPVIPVSSVSGSGLEQLDQFIKPGTTVALLGSSGVGKSTLINRIYGDEVQKTNHVRYGDDRGKHTTTSRELIVLPGRGLLIDTPGMRELQLWGTENGLGEAFEDIQHLSSACRFSDCRHEHEPGCAVQLALSVGDLDHERYANYQKLKRELAYLARKEDQIATLEEKAKWKKINKALKQQKHR
ncbi:MAG TPA: ribosome small subunit-dependent GTPase A [Candidatus Deferrimicrobium sp.]|nr:ribosome small subunit-dependent GTPase A [Candidatus Deferrimicrobium sp.]